MKVSTSIATLLLTVSMSCAVESEKDNLASQLSNLSINHQSQPETFEDEFVFLTKEIEKVRHQAKSTSTQYQQLTEKKTEVEMLLEQCNQAYNLYNSLLKMASLESSTADIDVESDIKFQKSRIEQLRETITQQEGRILELEKTKESYFENARKSCQLITLNNQKITTLDEENKQLDSEVNHLHQEILAAIRQGKVNHSYLETRQKHKREQKERNREKIRELNGDNRDAEKSAQHYKKLAQDYQEMITNLKQGQNQNQFEIEESRRLINSLMNKLADLKMQQKMKAAGDQEKVVGYQQKLKEINQNFFALKPTLEEINRAIREVVLKHGHLLDQLKHLEQKKNQKVEEKRLNVFEMIKSQFPSLDHYEFNQLYAQEHGFSEEIIKSIIEKLEKKQKEEEEREQCLRREREEAKRQQQLKEEQQSVLANQLKDQLLTARSVEEVTQTIQKLDTLTWYWNHDGSTLLHHAVEGGSKDLVSYLLSLQWRGIQVNAKLNNGESVLHRAAFLGHVEIIELLLNAGANVFAKTSDHGVSILEAAWNYFEGCIVQKAWDKIDNAHKLIKHILNAMSQDSDGAGEDGSHFPPKHAILLLVNRVCDSIRHSSLDENRRLEEEQRVRDQHQQFLQMILQQQQYMHQKKKEEKRRQEQQRYYYQPQYRYH